MIRSKTIGTVFLLLSALYNYSQNDSIFFYNSGPVACKVEEVSDEWVVFQIPGASRTFSTATNKIERIKYRNGKSESFAQYKENTENVTKGESETYAKIEPELKSKLEGLAAKSAKKIKHCAIGETDNFSSSIDWSLTHYDNFDNNIILVYFTVFYDHKLESQRESFKVRLTVNNSEKTILWKLLMASDKKDELAIIRCQEKGF